MNWIKVKKETPNYDFEVIVCDKHGQVTTAWFRKDEFVDCFETFDGEEIKNITHWMPL